MQRRLLSRVFVTGLAAVCCVAALAQGDQFSARLSTVPISAAERDRITGNGSATATLDGRRLVISGSFRGLQGPATTGTLHMSPATGVRGPAISEVGVDHETSGSVAASIDLSREQVQALRDGRLYIEIASDAAPEGNLWGWLLE